MNRTTEMGNQRVAACPDRRPYPFNGVAQANRLYLRATHPKEWRTAAPAIFSFRIFQFLISVALAVMTYSTHAASASNDYSILHSAFLSGGGQSASPDFAADVSFGEFGGFVQSADGSSAVWLGQVGQFNRSPVISTIANTSADGGSSPVLNFTVSDPESLASALQISGSSSDSVLIPSGGIVLTGSGDDRTIQLFSARGRTGTAVITIRAVDDEGLEATKTFNVTVTVPAPKLAPNITWATPAAITYGTALSAGQLNATANVAGTFTYAPASGTAPNAGTANLSVTFTPSDTENYDIATKTVTLAVNKAPLTIRAEDKFKREGDAMPTLTAVYTGFVNGEAATVLDSPVVLSTTATTSSALGSYPITASGASDANYTITFVNGTLTVTTRLVPRITWSNPAAIVYGTALSSSQLNATADVAGSFSYNPPMGTVLNAGQGRVLSVTFTPSDTLNYEPVTAAVGIDVAKAPLTIRAEDKSKAYGAALPALTAIYTGFVNGDTAASLDSSVSLSSAATAASDAGTYAITSGAASDADYAITFQPGTLTVTKAALTIRADNKSKVYGAALPALSASYTGFVNGDTAASLDTAVSLSTTATASSNVGSYTITAGGAGDANYTISFESGTLSVSKAALTIRADDKNAVYGSALLTLTASYSGFVNGDTAASLTTPAALTTTATASSNAGSYPINVSGATASNYTITFTAGTLTIGQAPLTIRAEDKSKVYGAALPTLTASYIGFVNGDTAASLNTPVSLATTATASSNAGSYAITASGAADANYAVTFEAGTLTVSKATLTIRAEDKSNVYGVALPALTATYSGFVNQDTVADLDVPVILSTSATASSNVGSYPITASGAADANYNIAFEPGTLSVTKAALTIRAEDKFMKQGDPVPALTAVYTGFVNQDTPDRLDVPVTLSTAASASSSVGNYAITASGASSANYTITHANGTLTITLKSVPRITWANPAPITYGTALSATQLNATADVAGTFSYTPPLETALGAGQGQVLSATFTPSDEAAYETLSVVVGIDVLKAALTVRAENKSKIYGASLPALTATYSGFVNGDTATNLDTPVSLSSTATAASGVGTYSITASGASDANYAVAFEAGTLTVTRAPLTIRAEDKTKAYGAALPALTASYTGFVSGDTASSLDSPVSLSTTATEASNVGSFPITASGAASANYTITFEPGTLNVSKAALTIAAEIKSKVYGAALPALTASYTGFVNGDNALSLGSPASLSTTATASSNAGSYPITISGASAANYTIAFQNGTLTVAKAPLTIRPDDKTKAYGAALPALTVSYTGFVNGDTVASLTSAASLSTTARGSSNAGSYPITAGGASGANYSITFIDGMLTVTKVPLTIRAENKSKVYGAALPTLTATYSGFVNGDTAANLDTPVSLSTPATASSNAGSYAITAGGASDIDYNITFEAGTLTVTRAALTIRADDKFKKQGETLPVLTASYTGFVNGDTVQSLDAPATLSTTAVASSAVGTYPITASGAAGANYTITQVGGTLTVTAKLVPRITWASPAPIVYGTALGSTQLNATADVAGSFSYNPPAGTVLNAGQGRVLSATFTPSDTVNYESITVPARLDVLRAPLTIRADDKSKAYGAALPELTASYSGFVNGDTAASLDSPVSLSTTATVANSVGSYPIAASGAASADYTISFESGTLTVTKAALSVTPKNITRKLGEPNPTLTGIIRGLKNSDPISAVYSTTATTDSPLGTYPITTELVDPNQRLSNYTVTVNDATLIVQLETTFTGVAQDGYVAGATVFFDANKNGVLNAGEPSTQTDSRGSFDLVVLAEQFDTNGNGTLDPAEGKLVLTGGTDISTGLPLQTPLTAPPGSTVVTPLTTLLSATIENNPTLSLAESKAKLNQSLGLPASVEVTTYDAIASAASNDGRAKDVLAAGAKVQDTLVQIASLVSAGDAAAKSQAASAVVQALAASVATGTSINLDQPATVQTLIEQSASQLGQAVSSQVKEGAAQIIAGANQVKTEIAATTGNALEAAQELSRSQVAGQSSVATVLQQVGTGAVTVNDAVTTAGKDALVQTLQTTVVGDVLGDDERPGTFYFSQSAFQTSSGGSAAPVVLNRSNGNFGEVSVVISLKNASGSVAATVLAQFKSRELTKTVDLLPTISATSALAQQETIALTLALATGAPAESALGSPAAATLTVRVPPTIIQQPSGGDVTRGGSVTLSVVATGTPAPSYQWQRNGVNLSGKTASALTLNNITESDGGTYRVVVSNSQGSVTSASAELRIVSAPVIARQPGGQDVSPGGTVTMSVVATGTPTPSYQWYKNGQPLVGQVSASLTLTSVTAADAGRYQVEVKNTLGSVLSDPAQVSIVLTPVILSAPANQTLTAGTALLLQVGATGTGLLYQWEKDAKPIAGATQPALTIASAQETDSGEYRVTIRNIAGSVTSVPALIQVYRPLVLLAQPQSQQVQAGKAATLTVQASGTGPLSYQWFKNGSAIAGATAAQLTFAAAQLSDAGSYHAEVTSPFGKVASARAQLDVFAPPAITRHPSSRTVFAGEDVRFEVEASGSQPLAYQWLKDGVALAGAQSAVLQLKSVQARDAGGYAVRVSNAYGSAQSVRADLQVIIVDAPVITVQPLSQTMAEGSSVTLTVSATGSAPLSYQWFKDGAPLAGATADRLEMKAVKASDAGEYTVAVSNSVGGTVSAAATLKVQQKIRVRGDLDGDGNPDIVLEDDKGFLAVWLLQGSRMLLTRFVEPAFTGDPGWRVAAGGDWNADSKEDLLFQHTDGTVAVWLMDGIALQRSALLNAGQSVSPNWRVVGAGDFNADGKSDIVFQHTDGTVAVWLMNGIQLQEARFLEPSQPGDVQWRALAVADFNGDGKDDVLFQHRDGSIGVWLMEGTRLAQASLLDPERANGEVWEVAGAADWDRDGRTDVLLRRPSDGALAIWFLDGTRLKSASYLTPLTPGGTWKPVAPR